MVIIKKNASRKATSFLFEKKITLIIFLIFIIFSFWLVYTTAGKTSRCTQSVHGLFHTAYVYQILNGIIPPTNPYSMGMPASNYWGWHLLLAIIVKTLNITPFESSLIVNTLALIIFLTAFWVGTGLFIRDVLTRFIFCTVPFIILTPIQLVRTTFSYIKNINYTPSLTDLLPPLGIFGMELEHRCILLPKFLNFNGFPTGIAIFTCLLVLVMRPLPNKKFNFLFYLLGAFLTGFFHPASGIGVAAIGIGGVGVNLLSFLLNQPKDTSKFIKEMLPFILIFIGLTIAFPYMLGLSRGLGAAISLNYKVYTIIINSIGFGLTIFPSILIYIFGLIRFQKLSKQGKMVLFVGILLLMGVIFIIIRKNTQYQFALLSSVPSSLLLLAIYQSYFNNRNVKTTHWYYPLLLLLISFLIIGIVNINVALSMYRNSKWAKKDPYLYNGQIIDLKVDSSNAKLQNRQKAYEWLRLNTPYNAYFLEYPKIRREILSPVIAQRRIVVSLPNYYTIYITHHEELLKTSIEFLTCLKYCNLTREKLKMLFDVKAPWSRRIYALISKEESHINKYEKDCLTDVSNWVSPVYANEHFIIYEVQNPQY